MKVMSWILVTVLALASFESEAARLGGGRSIGRQSSKLTQRQLSGSALAGNELTQRTELVRDLVGSNFHHASQCACNCKQMQADSSRIVFSRPLAA